MMPTVSRRWPWPAGAILIAAALCAGSPSDLSAQPSRHISTTLAALDAYTTFFHRQPVVVRALAVALLLDRPLNAGHWIGVANVLPTTGPMELSLPAIRGIGGAIIYLIDRYEGSPLGDLSIYDIDFVYLPGVDRQPKGAGFHTIDHLTHNVYGGRMAHWAAFYERIFNFREIRFFDIKGEYTGLTSKALTAPDGKIRIPLNEEGEGGKGQIEAFLKEFNGEGIQHIALICDDLVKAWDRLKEFGVPFMTAPPETYYEMLPERLPDHGEPVEELKARGILLDGTTEGGQPRLLLQIFAEAQVGPVFFEFIQRKGDEGFGEGNFKALFESMERDQIKRGTLSVEEAKTVETEPAE